MSDIFSYFCESLFLGIMFQALALKFHNQLPYFDSQSVAFEFQ